MGVTTALVGVGLAAGGYTGLTLALRRVGMLPPRFTRRALHTGMALQWLVAAGVGGYVLAIEGRPLSSAGVRLSGAEPPRRLLIGLLVGVATLVCGLLAVALLQRYTALAGPDGATAFACAQPWSTKLPLAVTAGVTEEFLFRGYLLERAAELTGSVAFAAVISVIAFALVHVPGRPARRVLPNALALGGAFTAAYLSSGGLLAPVLLHLVVDTGGLLNDPEEVLESVGPETVDERIRAAVDDA